MGHDEITMLWRGRIASGLLALALGGLVWATARRLFGPAGGMLSLLLYVLNPTILANGALMTSDLAAAFFLLASPLCLWALLQRLSAGRLLLSGLIMGGLAVSKMSAVVILPISLVLLAARLADGSPLPQEFVPGPALAGRGRQALAFLGVVLAHVLIVAAVIWACYGFRYSAFAPAASGAPGADRHYLSWADVLEQPTPTAPPSAPAARIFDFARSHRLLPEAFLYGSAYTWHLSGQRGAFLNGEYSLRGWRRFFPYTFLVKTPLALFGITALAVIATAARRRREPEGLGRRLGPALHATLPLWALLVCFWTAAICSHVNIGHRHILPTYAPLFVLCGAAAGWPAAVSEAGRRRLPTGLALLACLLVALAAEMAWRFPNYLAYFNGLVAPADGYRHLVDSSSDWGQELPALRDYLIRHPPAGRVYLAYFGSGSPATYRIPAELTNCILPVLDPAALPFYVQNFPREHLQAGINDFRARYPEFDAIGAVHQVPGETYRAVFLRKAPYLRLQAGTYFISGTILQSVKFGSVRPWGMPWGPWNPRYEQTYQQLRPVAQPYLSDDPAVRAAALARANPVQLWNTLLQVLEFDEFRFARLKAYLRHRPPDDAVNYSILVYRLTDAEIAQALDGPPAERGPDIAALEARAVPARR